MATVSDLAALVPREMGGWRVTEDDGSFTADSLFAHINGGAEIYRALNVQRVFARSFSNPNGPDILVDVFDMGSPSDAFGAYHNDTREDPSAGIGTESEVTGGNLFFWKGCFFVSVIALAETPAADTAVRNLAAAIAGAIDTSGAPPALVAQLPAEGRALGHLTYFHHWDHLNTRLFIADDDLLGLGADTEGVAARYVGPATLLLVRYPSKVRAEQGAKRFAARLLGGKLSAPVQREDGNWAGVRHTGRLVVAVWEARSRNTARRLLNAVEETP